MMRMNKRNITLISLLLLSLVIAGWGLEKNYEYDEADRLTKCWYNNGITINYTYDTQDNRTSKSITGLLNLTSQSLVDTEINSYTDADFAVLRLILSNTSTEIINISEISLTSSGSFNDLLDIETVRLYLDVNDNGLVDTGDTQLGADSVFDADDGTVTFSSLTQAIDLGVSLNLLVSITVSGNASASKTIQLSVPDSSSISAQGQTSTWQLFPLGVPITGEEVSTAGVFLPESPTGPFPADSATNIVTATAFDWNDCLGADSYDIYIWKASEAEPATPTSSDLTSCYYKPSQPLSFNTEYNWQVYAKNKSGNSQSSIWAFTTGNLTTSDAEYWDLFE